MSARRVVAIFAMLADQPVAVHEVCGRGASRHAVALYDRLTLLIRHKLF